MALNLNLNLTPVSTAVVVVDKYKVMVEMTDGQVLTFSTPNGAPPERDLNHYGSGGWVNLTRQQIAETIHRHNQSLHLAAAHALHQSKVQRLGHDYASRGY